jgi:hypothetical protein
MRLILKGWPTNYVWTNGMKETLINYLLQVLRGECFPIRGVCRLFSWTSVDNTTGCWGSTYILSEDNGSIITVPDLSTTFHIATYLSNANVNMSGHWNELAAIVLQMQDSIPYPFGSITPPNLGQPLWNHNAYDIASLFSIVWPYVNESLRDSMASQLSKFINTTLGMLQPGGSWPLTIYDDSPETAEYFGVALLAVSGYFEPATKCFWSANDTAFCRPSLPDPLVVTDQIASYIFHQLAKQGGAGTYYHSALQMMGLC